MGGLGIQIRRKAWTNGKSWWLIVSAVVLYVFLGSAHAVYAQESLAAPLWLSIMELPNGVDLRWFRVQGAVSYGIQRRSAGENSFRELAREKNPVYTDFLISRGTTYFYRIVPYTQNGLPGPHSEERYISLEEDQAGVIDPPQWGIIRVTPDGIALTWGHPNRKNVVAFNLYRRELGEGNFLLLSSSVDTTFLDRSVKKEASYEYALTALDRRLQESDFSKAVTVAFHWSAPKPHEKRPEQSVRTLEEVIRRTDLVAHYGYEQYGFVSPVDVEYLSVYQYLYLADSGTGLITVINNRGEVVNQMGGVGPEPWKFERLMGIAVDGFGTVLALDGYRGQIAVFDSHGIFQYRILMQKLLEEYFGPTFYLKYPNFRFGLVDIELAADGSIILTDNPNSWIYLLDPKGKLVNVISGRGEQPGQMHFPTFFAMGKNGRFFVSDTMNSRLQVFGPTGTPQSIIGEHGLGIGQFIRPKGIAIGDGGFLFVADSYQNVIQVFTTGGDYVGLLGDDKGLPLDLGLPNGIAFISPNQLAISEKITRRIQIRRIPMASLKPLSGGNTGELDTISPIPMTSSRMLLQEKSGAANEIVEKIAALARAGGYLSIRERLFDPGGTRLQGMAFPIIHQISKLAKDPLLSVRIELLAVKEGELKGSSQLGLERVKVLSGLLSEGAQDLNLYSIINPHDGVVQDRLDLFVVRK